MIASKAVRDKNLRKKTYQSNELLNICSFYPPDMNIIRKELKRLKTDLAVESAEELREIPIVSVKVFMPDEEEQYSDESEGEEDAEDLPNNLEVVEIK